MNNISDRNLLDIKITRHLKKGGTALHNNMRIVFEEMSSWTPLTMHLEMKTTF